MASYLPADETNATTPADVGRLLELILQGSEDPDAAARLASTPALCRLALEILSMQRLRNRLPSRLPRGTRVAHKTGTTAGNYNDAGIVFDGDRPLFVLTVYTDQVTETLPDGEPGHTAAQQLIGRLARVCYDSAKG
jgi:beta-lactamase class A